MADRTVSRLTQGIGPIVAVGLILLSSLYLMSNATQGSAWFGELYSLLLIINAIGLLGLAILIGWNLYRLLSQVRAGKPGARLTARMVVMIAVLSVTPVLVVYYFSLQFLHRGIDSWFDVRIERALTDALDLSRLSLEVRMRELLGQTERMALDLSTVADDRASFAIDDARRLSGATEATLIGPKGHIIATSNIEATKIVPHRPEDTVLLQLRQSGSYIGLDPIGNSGLHVRVLVKVPEDVATAEPRVLQTLFPVAKRMSVLADSVQSAYGKYRELTYLRRPLKISFTFTLSLVLLISLFTAVWAAFLSARRMVSPLSSLAEGTRAVADGDYETQLPPANKDEIGFLVESFNEMTRNLKRARDETRASQKEVEAQRAYLEAVLTRLSTGVVTLDAARTIVTANDACAQILGVDSGEAVGSNIDSLSAGYPELEEFVTSIVENCRSDDAEVVSMDWRAEVAISAENRRQTLILNGAPLARGTGYVVVFDDVTALIQAQRNAAWSEVARRLAHEIKNPLTPIQLSAERLRHKYLDKMAPADAEVMDRLTRTIVQQVESMKEMVNAFSDYARTPLVRIEPIDLNVLVQDVVELYRSDTRGTNIELLLGEDLPEIEADRSRLRQLLHNLIKNAIEASAELGANRVQIATRELLRDGGGAVSLEIVDSGPGFPEDLADRIFEPYITSKPKGTGLGLAIAKRIVEEHGAKIRAENRAGGGALVTVEFPVGGAPALANNAAVKSGGAD